MLTLRFFGGFEAEVNSRPLRRLHTRKGQELLAYLALRHGREVDRNRLAGTLWPDSTERLALSSLRRCLTDLRSALGGEAARLTGPTPRTLRLDLAGADVDLPAFDDAIRRGELDDLERAAALYRGDLLEGCAEEWVLPERRNREEAYLRALEALADRADAKGAFDDAVGYLRRVTGLSPLRETAHRNLIGVLAKAGRHAEGVQAYRELRLLLHRELLTEPSPETTRIYRALRDAGRLQAARISREPVTVRAAPPPRKLPVPLTPLIGREREIREVIERLDGARLVTLVGTGGVGKTRLAIRVAEEVGGEYPDGVAFVDLAPLSDPALVVPAVASALEVTGTPGQSALESLAAYVRTRSLLLVFDNCEHLVAECASLAETLLAAAPLSKVLATSRQALGIAGEWLVRTPSLSLPEPGDRGRDGRGRLDTAIGSEAVRLFVERARAVDGDFRLTEENVGTVEAICERLEGIPLALEMVAPRIRAFTPEEILGRLADRFRFVTGTGTTASSRQRTLEATLDWSYRLLAGLERTLLQRLSVFAGGFTRETAGPVCDLEVEVDAGIASLVDRSLLVRRESRSDGSRFGMLETVREYGGRSLEQAGEREAFLNRHAGYFLGFADEWESRLRGPEQRAVLLRLEEEHNNLRAALGWSLLEGGDPAAGLRLVGALHWFWLLHNHHAEGRRWIELALRKNAGGGDTVARAKALQGAGQLAFYQTDLESCRSYLEESIRLFTEAGKRRDAARSRIYLGAAKLSLSDPDGARECWEESISIGREEGDAWGPSMSLWMLGNSFMTRDEEKALQILRESEEMLRRIGDPWALSSPLVYLAVIHKRRDDLYAARGCLEEALDLVRRIEDRFRMVPFMIRLGEILYRMGDLAAAKRVYEEGILLFERMDDPVAIARINARFGTNLPEAYLHLGHIHRDRGDGAASRSFHERGHALSAQLAGEQGQASRDASGEPAGEESAASLREGVFDGRRE